MRKLSILFISAFLAVANVTNAYNINLEPTDPDAAADDGLLVWTSYRQPFNGSGTANDPYTIENAAQLAQLVYDVRNG
ncbi:MAG: hypothetical protein SPL55_02375, partial [Prevotella sp.]|nr:hypothetical protein [Prevotella sp.]